MTWQTGIYFSSIVLTCFLTGFLAWYAWQRPPTTGVRTFALICLAECLLGLTESISMLSATPEQALFWFDLRFLFLASVPVLWVVFSLEYMGRSDWLSKTLLTGLFTIPVLTQVFLWTNNLHHLWALQEVTFLRLDGFWIADTGVRVPGLWFLVHAFYTLLVTLTGVVILLVAAGRKRTIFRWQAILLSLGVLTSAAIGQVPTFNIFPQSNFNPIIPGMGIGGVFYLAAVIGFRFLGHAPTPERVPSMVEFRAEEKRSLASLVLIFILFVTSIAAIGFLTYQNYGTQFRTQVGDQLAAVADLKVTELEDWREERLADGKVLGDNDAFAVLVQDYFANPQDGPPQAELRTWLEKYQAYGQYDRMRLLDLGGTTRLSVPQDLLPLPPEVLQCIPDVIASGQVTMVDFYREETDGRVYMSLLIPILDVSEGSRVVGLVVLRIDPELYLYPYIIQWPGISATAETLLVRRDGEAVLYLNELKFDPGAALNLRIPIENSNVLSVRAALGETGILEGIDYRGVRVIGYARPVPDSPWFLVARMDEAEIYAPLKVRVWQTIIFFGALILAAGTGLMLIWRQQRLRYYRAQAEMLDVLQETKELYKTLFDQSADAVFLMDLEGRHVEANQRAADMLGYTRAEILELSLAEISTQTEESHNFLDHLAAGETIPSYERVFRKKNGETIYVELHITLIRDHEGRPYRIQSIVRDITERKHAEEKLRESESKYRLLAENISDVIWILDAETSRFRYVSPSVEQLRGYRVEEVMAQDVAASLTPASAQYLANIMPARVEEFKQGSLNPYRDEIEQPCKAGTTVWTETSTRYLLNPETGHLEVYGVSRNITERKQAEKALRESEEKFRKAFMTSPDAINLNRLQDGMYISINPGYTQIMGYTEADAIGKTSLELNVWENSEDRRRLVEGLRKHGVVENLEARFCRKDGGTRYGLMSASVIDLDGIPHILSITRDITERKAAEAALQVTLAKYETLFNIFPLGITVSDEAGGILESNPTAEKMLGIKQAEQARRTIDGEEWKIVNPDGMPMPPDQFASVRALKEKRTVENMEMGIVKPDGTTTWLNVSAAPLPVKGFGVVVTYGNITERKEAQDALQESEQKYRLLFDELLSGLAVHEILTDADGNPVDYRFLAVNTAFQRMTGLKAADILGRTVREVLPGTEPAWIERYGHVALTRQAAQFEDYSGVLGKHFEVRVFSPERGKFATIFNDITERKRAEETLQQYSTRLEADVAERTRELREAQKKLVRQERLAVLGQLAGSVGHELRNPLGVISNAAYYLKITRPQVDEKTKEYLQIIESETRTAEKIIADLLDFARIKKADREPVDVVWLVEQTLARYPIPAGMTITRRIGRGLPLVFSDAGQVIQVLGNLLVNACQAMEEKGKITISARRAGDMVAISVADTGPGISPENMKNLFEPLFTTKMRGIGLGLALSQRFVEANGGRLEVQSEAGKGAMFTVLLPVDEEDHE